MRTHTRREVLPLGAVFDSSGSLFFPMLDVYECHMGEGYELSGGRCLAYSLNAFSPAEAHLGLSVLDRNAPIPCHWKLASLYREITEAAV